MLERDFVAMATNISLMEIRATGGTRESWQTINADSFSTTPEHILGKVISESRRLYCLI